jgi:hypothetical protein
MDEEDHDAIHSVLDIDSGNVSAKQLFRAYKHTPHQPVSVFLKYITHRTNHLNEYDDPEQAHKLNQDFLKVAQKGGASEKNGHLDASDLHTWLTKNPKAVEDVLAHRDTVQNEIKAGVGMNVRDIHGVPHVALTRGLKSDIMNREHALSSWADVPDTGFGSQMHHAWVPLHDVWFGYHHFNKDYYGENFGHENEFLVSHTAPKYEAGKYDTQQSRLKNASEREKFGGIGPNRRQGIVHAFDDATDEELAVHVRRDKAAGVLSQEKAGYIADHPNAGPLTRQAFVDAGVMSLLPLPTKMIPREVAAEHLNRRNPYAAENPNLTSDDLHGAIESIPSPDFGTFLHSILRNPNATSQTAEKAWASLERRRNNLTGSDRESAERALMKSYLTPPHVLEGLIQKGVRADQIFRAPNLTPDQADRLVAQLQEKGEPFPEAFDHAPLTTKTIAKQMDLANKDDSVDSRRNVEDYVKVNPRAQDEALVHILENHKNPEWTRITGSFLLRQDSVGLSPEVQAAFVKKLGSGLSEEESRPVNKIFNARRSIVSLSESTKPLSDATVAFLVLGNVKQAQDNVLLNKAISVEQLERIWPKGKDLKSNADWYDQAGGDNQGNPYPLLANAIVNRRAYKKRKAEEHIIKPLPKDLAKSEDSIWQATLADWLNKQNQKQEYVISLSPEALHVALQERRIEPAFTPELLEGRSVLAHPAKPHRLKVLKESLPEGHQIFCFETKTAPQKGPNGQVYWTAPVELTAGRVHNDDSLVKAENSELNLSPRGLDDWEERAALFMLGHNPETTRILNAAKFLAGDHPLDMDRFHLALKVYDSVERAALYGYEISDSEQNLRALRSILDIGGKDLAKGEASTPAIKSIEPGVEEATHTAHEVQRAIDAGQVYPLNLGGKHSKGALAARDPKTGYTLLLKPGSGKNSPAAGVRDEKATQSQREACGWHIADLMGLGKVVPHCDLLIEKDLTGEHQWAAMRLLGPSFKSMGDLDKVQAVEMLRPYLASGELFRWACFDLIIGNPDRHSDNILVNDSGAISLIDLGSAFAGANYSPATDKSSFIPFYLRAFTREKMAAMLPHDRYKAMPKLPENRDAQLRVWLANVDPYDVKAILELYGVNPEPTLERLKMLRDVQHGLSDTVCKFFAGLLAEGH